MKKIIFIAPLAFSIPSIVFAAWPPQTFKDVVELFLRILQNLILILFSALVVGLVYAVAMYMINSDNEKKREELKPYLLWAVIGITVVFGLWGFIGVLNATIFGGNIGIIHLTAPS